MNEPIIYVQNGLRKLGNSDEQIVLLIGAVSPHIFNTFEINDAFDLDWGSPNIFVRGPHKLLHYSSEGGTQARNQLGIPGGAKSFLRGGQIFWIVSNSFKLCPTHFSRGTSPPPWLRAWPNTNSRSKNVKTWDTVNIKSIFIDVNGDIPSLILT